MAMIMNSVVTGSAAARSADIDMSGEPTVSLSGYERDVSEEEVDDKDL
jgi:hypothetical protein